MIGVAFAAFLGTLAALLVAALVLLLLFRRISLGIVFAPSPTLAAAKRVPDCTVPSDAASLRTLNAAVTGGVLRAPQISVPHGLTLALTSSLVLVADDLLQVDGVITLAAGLPQGRIVDVTLVSLNGSVTIGPTGQVGAFGTAAASAPPDVSTNPLFARATAAAGTNGGAIAILAPQGTIDVQGAVYGFSGGDGGAATATSAGVIIPLAPLGSLILGGSAGAAGGQGGFGGDVILCALDGIQVSGIVFGSFGGAGGAATATAAPREDALAIGGPGNAGGDVILQGLVAGMAVRNDNILLGGGGGSGGAATATGGPAASANGGNGDASGGKGGGGATVLFRQCVVEPQSVVSARLGGAGGNATATGGLGAGGFLFGGAGGDADARAGDAGAKGALPTIPLPGGGTAQGIRPTFPAPSGGNASATGGNGGAGRLRGGRSGRSDAQGGIGNGGTPAARVSNPRAPPTGGAGGIATPAASPGTP